MRENDCRWSLEYVCDDKIRACTEAIVLYKRTWMWEWESKIKTETLSHNSACDVGWRFIKTKVANPKKRAGKRGEGEKEEEND